MVSLLASMTMPGADQEIYSSREIDFAGAGIGGMSGIYDFYYISILCLEYIIAFDNAILKSFHVILFEHHRGKKLLVKVQKTIKIAFLSYINQIKFALALLLIQQEGILLIT